MRDDDSSYIENYRALCFYDPGIARLFLCNQYIFHAKLYCFTGFRSFSVALRASSWSGIPSIDFAYLAGLSLVFLWDWYWLLRLFAIRVLNIIVRPNLLHLVVYSGCSIRISEIVSMWIPQNSLLEYILFYWPCESLSKGVLLI